MDLLGPGAVGLVAAEWLALGTLSGVDWPGPHPPLWAARAGLRVLVGGALIGIAQLVLAACGVGFGSIPLVLLAAALGAGALRLLSRGPACQADQPMRLTTGERAGWLVLGGLLIAASVRSLLVPEAGWDAYSHWGLRAQAYALAGGSIVSAHSEHEYYPPLVPLLEAWLYLHRGGVSIDLGKTVWALLGSAFALCLAQHLRLSLRSPWLAPWLAAAIVVATTGLLEGFWTGQADLPLTAYLTLATLAIVQCQRAPEKRWLILAAIFGAAAALTKFEGLPRVGVVVAALGVEVLLSRRRSGLFGAAVLGLAAVLAALVWTTFELTHGITPNAEHIGQFQPLAIGSVLLSLAAVFGGVRTGGGLLIAAITWAVTARHLPRLLVVIVLGQLAATLVAFLLSDTSPEVEVRTAATRLFEQFLPLALFAGAVGLSTEMSTYNRPGR
jgi:hypothetical protein